MEQMMCSVGHRKIQIIIVKSLYCLIFVAETDIIPAVIFTQAMVTLGVAVRHAVI